MEETAKKKSNMFHLFRLHLHDENNDLNYRGPLSYRHLRIIGWAFMMFMALSVVFGAFAHFKKIDGYQTTIDIFSWIGSLALPILLLSFFLLTIIFAIRKRRYLKNGHTEDEFDRYLNSNSNSLLFFILTCIVFFVAVIIDIIITVFCSASVWQQTGVELAEAIDAVMKTGLGQTAPVIFTFPIIILFSYSRDYENKLIDKIIPLAGIALCAYSVIETFVQLWALR